jgi:hypothetical protein
VAKRKDITRHTRFAKIETPVVSLPVGKPRAARAPKPPRLPSSVRALFVTFEKETRKKGVRKKRPRGSRIAWKSGSKALADRN